MTSEAIVNRIPQNLRKALKEHVCTWCGRKINKDEVYFLLAGRRPTCLKCTIEILKKRVPDIDKHIMKWIRRLYGENVKLSI